MNGDHLSSEFSVTTTSPSLLAAAREQDQEAWQRLAGLYEPLIHEWCRKSQISSADIPDIKQEVLAAVWRSLGDFRKSNPGDSFRGWLKAITRNKIRDHFRRRKGQGVAQGGSTAQLQLQELPDLLSEILPEPDRDTSLSEERQVFFRALELIRAEFESKTWQAFWMTVVDGRSAVETASELSVSAGSVRQSKYKVLRRLRCELGDLVPDSSPNVK